MCQNMIECPLLLAGCCAGNISVFDVLSNGSGLVAAAFTLLFAKREYFLWSIIGICYFHKRANELIISFYSQVAYHTRAAQIFLIQRE